MCSCTYSRTRSTDLRQHIGHRANDGQRTQFRFQCRNSHTRHEGNNHLITVQQIPKSLNGLLPELGFHTQHHNILMPHYLARICRNLDTQFAPSLIQHLSNQIHRRDIFRRDLSRPNPTGHQRAPHIACTNNSDFFIFHSNQLSAVRPLSPHSQSLVVSPLNSPAPSSSPLILCPSVVAFNS